MKAASELKRVLYTAAHGGFASQAVPLGGGAAVCDHLVSEWTRTRPFPLELITPSILGSSAPSGADLVRFGERDYARFSRVFEKASTAEILKHDPADTVVLANDVSEGPDFKALARNGFRVLTIYHVDVVAYVTEMYGRGWIPPQATTRLFYPLFGWALPDIAGLVWAKQAASVRYSSDLIMPSEGMRQVMSRCYPQWAPSKIRVLPWGSWDPGGEADPQALRREFDIPAEARVLLTLSRISPEKGQDLLLEALFEWERKSDFPDRPLWLFICGAAAFMQGQKHLEKLRNLAARLRRTRVVFPGHVTGLRKRSFFALADLFVFPSKHESYGLTLLEALAAGVPAVCLDHHGARAVMREEFGAIVKPRQLGPAIARLLQDEAGRSRMSQAARAFAAHERFSDRAAELARLILA